MISFTFDSISQRTSTCCDVTVVDRKTVNSRRISYKEQRCISFRLTSIDHMTWHNTLTGCDRVTSHNVRLVKETNNSMSITSLSLMLLLLLLSAISHATHSASPAQNIHITSSQSRALQVLHRRLTATCRSQWNTIHRRRHVSNEKQETSLITVGL